MQAGKAFELVQRIALLERFGVHLDGCVGGVATRASAGGFLGVTGVWRRVGAEEEFRIATGSRVQQCHLVGVALEDRQAIEVRTNTANQHVVAVVQQVLGSDGRTDVGRRLADELRGIAGGDVFEHHLERREAFDHTAHVLVDEALLAIEYVDFAAGHFTMHQQWHADFSQRLDGGEDVVDAGHARIGVGGSPGRVQFGSVDDAAGLGRADILGAGAVGEVQHHQWLEAAAGRAGSQDALTVGTGLAGVAYRGYQVGHDDGAGESTRHIANGMGQDGTIAQMDVPVVGTQEGQAIGHWGFQAGRTQAPMLPENPGWSTAIKFSARRPIACR
ncbi:hypothetical protein D3C81_306010 [compost metagenome]